MQHFLFHLAPKKNLLLFPEMRAMRKIFTRAAAKFFLINFLGIITSSVSFAFLILVFFVCLFDVFFEIKHVYYHTHSTMRAGQ